MVLVAVVTTFVALPAGWIPATHGNQTSGDEPHYLLTADSLGLDGDLDVSNQVDREDYRPVPRATAGAPGSHGGDRPCRGAP